MVNMVVIITLEIVFSILGMIVIAWFSRKREFRADEGGAALSGKISMISALMALKNTFENSEINSQQTPASIAAFQISNKSSIISLFSTHPPLDTRIQVLKNNRKIL